MQSTIQHYTTAEDIARACDICLKHNLYSIHGVMRRWFNDPVGYDLKACFIVYNENNTPVGSFVVLSRIVTYYPGSIYNCGTYIKSKFRRKGYGKSLVAFAKQLDYDILPWKESREASLFYNNI